MTYVTMKTTQTYLSSLILRIYIMGKETTSQENTHDENFIFVLTFEQFVYRM